MREYRIYPSDLGRRIFKKTVDENNYIMEVLFLWANKKWVRKMDHAKTYYTKSDAISALTIMKMKDGKESD